ncbi:MAG: POTRA domain-containing protein [Myxococcota bacterium]
MRTALILAGVAFSCACATTSASRSSAAPAPAATSEAPSTAAAPTCPTGLPTLRETPPPFGATVEKVCLVGASEDSYLRLHEQVAPREGTALDADAVREDIEDLFKMGFVRDVVAIAEQLPTKGVMLSYVVAEYDRVAEVKVTGVKAFEPELLSSHVPLGLPASLALRKALEDKTRELYTELGYAHVQVKVALTPREKGAALLALDVDEGPRVLVQEVKFAGVKQAPEAELRKVLRSKVGEPFSEEEVLRDAAAVTAVYYDRGMVNVRVESTHAEAAGAVTVVFTVDEGPVFRVGKLLFRGDALRETEAARKKLETKPRSVFNRSQLQRDMERLREHARKQGLEVEVTPITTVNAERKVIDLTLEVVRRSDPPPR